MDLPMLTLTCCLTSLDRPSMLTVQGPSALPTPRTYTHIPFVYPTNISVFTSYSPLWWSSPFSAFTSSGGLSLPRQDCRDFQTSGSRIQLSSTTFTLVSLIFDSTRSKMTARNASTPSFTLRPTDTSTTSPTFSGNGRGTQRQFTRKRASSLPPSTCVRRVSASPSAGTLALSHSSLSSSLRGDPAPSPNSVSCRHSFPKACSHQPLQDCLTSYLQTDWVREQLTGPLSYAVLPYLHRGRHSLPLTDLIAPKR